MKRKIFRNWAIAVVMIAITATVTGCGSNEGSTNGNEDSSSNNQSSSKQVTAKTEPFETELSNGHFTAGIDFPAGTYNIEAVSGGGNVSSDNA